MANDTKILIFMDEEQGRVVRYQCKLRNNLHYGQLNEFYNYPYRMRLDSNLSSFSPLQEGKSTKDIITTFNEMLEIWQENLCNYSIVNYNLKWINHKL